MAPSPSYWLVEDSTMRRGIALALLAALVIPFPAAGQAKPDFSGTWTLDAARSETPPGRGGRGGGGPVTIKQTAAEITIGMLTYKLDGSESVNQVQGRGGMQEVKGRAKFDGANLVIESTRDFGGMSVTSKEVRTLGAGGKEMTVQTIRSTPQGDVSFKQVYTKS
jgi:hypothetical protein